MRYEIRELNIGGILDQAIKLLKDNFVLFVLIACVLFIPFNIITKLMMLWSVGDAADLTQPGMFAPGQQGEFHIPQQAIAIGGFITMVNLLVVSPVTDAALIFAIANSYLQKPISLGKAYSRAFKILLPLLGTWILYWLAIALPMVIGFIAFIAAGPIGLVVLLPMIVVSIVCAFWFMLASRIVVVEGIAGSSALSRSKRLMKGNVGTAFALGVVIGLIGALIGAGVGFIPQLELRAIVQTFVEAILSIFAAAAFVVFYFSCRCKIENFDLAMLAEAVAAEEPVAAM